MRKPLLLWEIKTIDGDGPIQVRLAVGQLLFYEYFKVQPRWPDRKILKLVGFDQEISLDLVNFLSWLNIGAFRVAGDGSLKALNAVAEQAANILADLNS